MRLDFESMLMEEKEYILAECQSFVKLDTL